MGLRGEVRLSMITGFRVKSQNGQEPGTWGLQTPRRRQRLRHTQVHTPLRLAIYIPGSLTPLSISSSSSTTMLDKFSLLDPLPYSLCQPLIYGVESLHDSFVRHSPHHHNPPGFGNWVLENARTSQLRPKVT